MNKRLPSACFALALSHVPNETCAQFNDPRTYDNTPVGINQLELSYAHVHANASIDTSLIIEGVSVGLNQGTIDYTRYFGLLHRLAWVEAAVPVAGFGGSFTGASIQGSTTGMGDSSYRLAILLKGGPALTVAQFQSYKPTTTLGVSLTITAPTGSYHSDKILNLGSDRWSFKPEIALTRPFGPEQRWEFNAYANAYFYTDNTSYRGRQILGQEALPGLEGHISYSLSDVVWLSLDTRYSFRGTTSLNGVTQKQCTTEFRFGQRGEHISQSSKLSGPRIRQSTRASQRPGPCRLQREV